MQPLTDRADPVIHGDFGAAPVQRRLTTHGDPVCALPPMQTPILDIPHPLRIAAGQPLVHEVIVGGCIVARLDAFKPLPVLDTDLLEDVPIRRGCWNHEGAPSWGMGMLAMPRLYHVSPTQSTPSSASPGHAHIPPSP